MSKPILDPKELLGFRLVSEEEVASASATSAKIGYKNGTKVGYKPKYGTDA